jgi:sulfide:quinone oxidoreductase
MIASMVGIATSSLRAICASIQSFPAAETRVAAGSTFSFPSIRVNEAAAEERLMADIRRLTADYAVSPQLTVQDVAEAAAAGYRTIVSNRPDGEAPGQPRMDEIEAAARAASITFVRNPIAGPPPLAAVDRTAQAMAESPGPILAYCRSGTRSATLWAMAAARAGKLSAAEIVAAARAAGYDLSGQAEALERLRRSG